MQDESFFDVIILGGGPSGLTAAVYTSRANLRTLLLAGNPSGGQLMLTSDIENFPGFPQAITGPELISKMRTQAERFGTKILDQNALKLDGNFESGFSVKTDTDDEFKGKTILISTGASAKWLDIPSEQKLRGKGVSACATCDGYFFKDKVVAVVGGGDSAMEESTFLTNFATKVYVLVRGKKDAMRASPYMRDRAFSNKKIEFMFETSVVEVLGEERVTGLKVNAAGNTQSIEVGGLFIAIGHTPNTGFLSGYLDLSDLGYISVSELTRTSVEGVFACGDVSDSRYRQAISAAGFGCMAALDAQKLLSHRGK